MTPARVMKIEKHFPAKTLRDASAKVGVIADTFGVSQTRYYQRLNQLIDDPAFIALDPVMARILRDRRAAALRSGRGRFTNAA